MSASWRIPQAIKHLGAWVIAKDAGFDPNEPRDQGGKWTAGGGSVGKTPEQMEKQAADKAWNEADHPRGQPENAGEFGPGGGSSANFHPPKAKKTEWKTVEMPSVRGGAPANTLDVAIDPTKSDVQKLAHEDDNHTVRMLLGTNGKRYAWHGSKGTHFGLAGLLNTDMVDAKEFKISDGKLVDTWSDDPSPDRWFRKTNEPESLEFVSSNLKHLDFKSALQALNGERHRTYVAAAEDIDAHTGLLGEEQDCLGVWRDGAENSTLFRTKNVKPELLRANAALKGLLAKQKAVLTWRDDIASGPDTLYEFDSVGPISVIRDDLEKHGLNDFTLLPNSGGAHVLIVDTSAQSAEPLSEKLAKYVELKAYDVTVRHGHAELIGSTKYDSDDEQRADAQAIYEQILSRDNAGAGYRELRDRWQPKLSQAQDAGRWLTGRLR